MEHFTKEKWQLYFLDRIRGQLLLAGTRTNGKRGRDDNEIETCGTKKVWRNWLSTVVFVMWYKGISVPNLVCNCQLLHQHLNKWTRANSRNIFYLISSCLNLIDRKISYLLWRVRIFVNESVKGPPSKSNKNLFRTFSTTEELS